MNNSQNYNYTGQPVQMPYVQPPQKKSKVGLIIALVLGIPILIGVIIAVFVPLINSLGVNSNGRKNVGTWECTGNAYDIELTINSDDTFKVVLKSGGASAKLEGQARKTVAPEISKRKDDYKYVQYIFTSAVSDDGTQKETITESDKRGFIFGINSDGEGHYIGGAVDTALEFTCTKK